jgi:hypothetical protein
VHTHFGVGYRFAAERADGEGDDAGKTDTTKAQPEEPTVPLDFTALR